MPIFEYKCKECGKSFDHLVLSKSQPLPECPACGSKDPVKQVSTFSTSGGGSKGFSGGFSGAPT